VIDRERRGERVIERERRERKSEGGRDRGRKRERHIDIFTE